MCVVGVVIAMLESTGGSSTLPFVGLARSAVESCVSWVQVKKYPANLGKSAHQILSDPYRACAHKIVCLSIAAAWHRSLWSPIFARRSLLRYSPFVPRCRLPFSSYRYTLSHGATGMSMLGCLCNKDGQGPVISDSNRPRSRSRERSEGNKSDKSDGKKENSQAEGEDSPPYGRSFDDTSDRAPVARPLVKFSVSDFLLLIITTSGRSHSALRTGLSQLSSECQNRTSLPIFFFGCWSQFVTSVFIDWRVDTYISLSLVNFTNSTRYMRTFAIIHYTYVITIIHFHTTPTPGHCCRDTGTNNFHWSIWICLQPSGRQLPLRPATLRSCCVSLFYFAIAHRIFH